MPSLIRECKVCGDEFAQERKRGRPAVTCSTGCRQARGRNGDCRLDDAARDTGYVALDWTVRTGSGGNPAEASAADLLGFTEPRDGGWHVVFRRIEDPATGKARTEDHLRRHMADRLDEERQHAAAQGQAAVSDTYSLPGGADVGRTCPGIADHHVIGQADVAADWQEHV